MTGTRQETATTASRATCTCGKCRVSEHDDHGNRDYGMIWSATRGTYVVRNCEVARERARQQDER